MSRAMSGFKSGEKACRWQAVGVGGGHSVGVGGAQQSQLLPHRLRWRCLMLVRKIETAVNALAKKARELGLAGGGGVHNWTVHWAAPVDDVSAAPAAR